MIGRLHVITDSRPGRDALAAVGAALAAGAPVVQVRVAGTTTDREAYDFAVRVRARCDEFGATCLVNDRLDVALAAGAAGAHVGADDLPVAVARRLLGPAAVLGATCRDPARAKAAVADGATYLGAGPAYPTPVKDDLRPIGPDGIGAVAAAVPDTPVIAIGGVTAAGVPPLRAAGAHGVAVISAISGAADPGAATREILEALA